MTDLTVITNMMIEKHKERYAIDPTDLAPMLITFKDDVPAGIYLSPNFTDPEMKDLTIPMFAEIVNKDQADSYVFTTEAWMAPMDDEDDLPPRLNPERMEVVIVAAYSKQASLHRMMKIVRRDDNSVETLEETKSKGSFSSRFDIYTRGSIN